MNSFWSAIIFYSLFYPMVLVLGILLLLALFILVIIGLFIKKPYSYSVSDDTWKLLESNILKQHVHTSTITPITYHYKCPFTNQTYTAKLLHLRTTKDYDASKPPMILIHGIRGSCMSWYVSMDGLAKECSDLYILNLPGYAYTDGPQEMVDWDIEKIYSFYNSFIEQTYHYLNISSAVVIGYSYGAILSVKYAQQHPSKVYRLILSACPCIHPTLSKYAMYLQLAFTYNFPQNLLRLFGHIGVYATYTLMNLLSIKNTVKYYDVQLWIRSWGDKVVYKLFHSNFKGSYLLPFLLKDILSLQIPLAFITGEKDYLIPSHNITILSNITDSRLPIYVMKEAGHNPAKLPFFANVVKHAVQHAQPCGEKSKNIVANFNAAAFKSSYSTKETEKTINNYYRYLKSLAPPNIQTSPVHYVSTYTCWDDLQN